MTEISNQKCHLSEFDYSRGLAAVSVIAIHVTSLPIATLEKQSVLFQLFFFINRSLQFAVPLFLVMSALLEGYHIRKTKEINWKNFYLRKLKRIVLPYIAWSALYLFFYTFIMQYYSVSDIITPRAFFKFFGLGKASYHLYFMIILIQFYLVFPLLANLRKLSQKKLIGLILLNYLLQIGFNLFVEKRIYPVFPEIVTTYFWYFFILNSAFLIGLYYPEAIFSKVSVRVFIFLAALGAGIYYIYESFQIELHGKIASAMYLPIWYLYTFFLSFVVLYLCQLFCKPHFQSRKTCQFFKQIGIYSYGIYFVHPLIIIGLEKILNSLPPLSPYKYGITILIFYLLTIFLSYLFSRFTSKIRIFSWLIGR